MQKVNASIPITLSDCDRQVCEVWTRVMGYHRPVSSFNIGKKGEFAERKFYREAAIKSTHRGSSDASTG